MNLRRGSFERLFGPVQIRGPFFEYTERHSTRSEARLIGRGSDALGERKRLGSSADRFIQRSTEAAHRPEREKAGYQGNASMITML